MGKIITAPDELPGLCSSELNIFLAGGITGCPDWQTPTAKRLAAATHADTNIMTPRRPYDMDMRDPKLSHQQIYWEHQALIASDIILFWFPAEGLCMITLFELGKELGRNEKDIYVGVHPDYARKLDVEIQSRLEGVRTIYYDLDAMIEAVLDDN